MKIITTPDNEREVWDGSQKVGYIENDRLYLLGGEFVGIFENVSNIANMIRNKKAVRVVSRTVKSNVIKWN